MFFHLSVWFVNRLLSSGNGVILFGVDTKSPFESIDDWRLRGPGLLVSKKNGTGEDLRIALDSRN